MSEPNVTETIFANPPSADGTTPLRVKFFRPAEAEGPLPLLVWFHSGGFKSGTIDSPSHKRISHWLNRRGYATAFVQYRLRGRPKDLTPTTRALLPALVADAQKNANEINPLFVGSAALAALEDAGAFFTWLKDNAAEQGFSDQILLGGSSAGAMTVLNLLNLAPHLGLDLPEIRTAFVMSGAFAYPSFFTPNKARVLALHGSHEQQIPVSSIRAYAARDEANCTLLEDADHQHGDLRVTRAEHIRHGVRRMARFDAGQNIASARTGTDNPVVKDTHKICIFTCVKNEGPFLLEWVAHNRAIGVTDFIVFSNDCTDGTTELLDRLDEMGIVNHIPNPSTALKTDQHLSVACACAPHHRALKKADYAILSDVDEFIQINVGDGTLNGLIAAAGYPDVLSLAEHNFGFDGIETFQDRPITEQFSAAKTLQPERQNARRGVKSIMRVCPEILAYSNHRPMVYPHAFETIRWRDGSGQRMPREFIEEHKRGLDVRSRYRMAKLNHYTLRSGESMLVKFNRGDAVRRKRLDLSYIQHRNGRDIFEDGMQHHLPGLRAELDALMQDPQLAQLHANCVTRHRKIIEKLKSDPDYAEIWQEIKKQAALPCGDAAKPAEAAE